MKKQIPLSVLIKLISFYSLIIGIIGTILVFGIVLTKKQSTPTPTTTMTVTPTIKEQFCGGIAAIKCPNGYTCKLSGNYPDAGGTCIKNHN